MSATAVVLIVVFLGSSLNRVGRFPGFWHPVT